jgi:hypothetical protein
MVAVVQYCVVLQQCEKSVVRGIQPCREPFKFWRAVLTEMMVSMVAVAQYCAVLQRYEKDVVHGTPP